MNNDMDQNMDQNQPELIQNNDSNLELVKE